MTVHPAVMGRFYEDFVIGDAGSALASSDLEIDSIIEASSPSLAKGVAAPSGADSHVVGGSGTLSIDLGSGSIGGLSGPAAAAQYCKVANPIPEALLERLSAE